MTWTRLERTWQTPGTNILPLCCILSRGCVEKLAGEKEEYSTRILDKMKILEALEKQDTVNKKRKDID